MGKRSELKAKMASKGGWGEIGSDSDTRYGMPRPQLRRRCPNGCGNRATHMGMANGVALVCGCEFHVTAWVRAAAVSYLEKGTQP